MFTYQTILQFRRSNNRNICLEFVYNMLAVWDDVWVCVMLSSCVLRAMYMRVMYLCAAKSIKRLHDVCLHVLDLLGQGEDLSVDIRCFSCCVVNTFVMCEFNVIIIKSKYPMHSSKVCGSKSSLHLSLCIHTCLCEHIEKELS